MTDPNDEAVTMSYDGLDRLITFTDERASVTATTYGDTDQPATITDPNTVVTTYVRNGWGEAIEEQSNDIGTIVYERDQKGNVTKRTDARAVVANFTYDDASRETSVAYPGETASNVSYSYDSVAGGNKGIGRLTGVTDAAGTVAYTYDLLGRVLTEVRVIGAQTYTIAYEWNAAGKIDNITYPSGRTILFDRDSNGEIEVVRNRPSGGADSWLVFWVGRTPFGPRAEIQFANGMRERRRYDHDGRIVALETLVEATFNYVIDKTYEYNDDRNLTNIGDIPVPAINETFNYTDNGFLQSATGPYGTISFTNDGVGNRTQRVTNTGTPITDVYGLASGSNRMSTVTTNGTLSRTFDHDPAGNIVEDDNVATSTLKEFAFNHPGQLSAVEVNSTAQGAYLYDYLSRLVSRGLPASSTTLHLVHDLDGNVIAEYDSTGALITEYVWMDDRPLALIADAGTTPVTYWVHTDHLERPVLMTDDTATTVWQASYLPFGEVVSITGSAIQNYRFPGQWFQLESGLHYNWHRHYDPTTGRYIQPDPLGMPDGPSRWAYVKNSPLMEVDPSGLQAASGYLSMPDKPQQPNLCTPVSAQSCQAAFMQCKVMRPMSESSACLRAYWRCTRTGLPTIFAPGIWGQS